MTRSILALASLALIWAFCAPISAQPRAAGLPKEVVWREARGGADKVERAKEIALDDAHKKVVEMMQAAGLKSFKVDKEYVRKHVLADNGRAGDDELVPNDAPLKTWVVSFRSDADWWNEIVRQDRAEVRHQWTAQAMLGISIVLLFGFAYLRLDEYTQRRYTTSLRALGLVIATGAIIALWWIAG